jgi:GT2 family glycosyltransferase
MPNPKVAVVVPVYGRLSQTLRFLESFQRVQYSNYEMVIVDDNSPDGTAESLAREHPDVTVLAGDGNLWWTGGTNLGVRYALARGFDYVLTINNDTCVEPDFLGRLVETARTHAPCIVGSRMQLLDRPTTVRALGGRTNWRGGDVVGVCEQFVEEDEVLARHPNPAPVELLTGCGTLVPADCYRAIGLYDGRMFPHYHSDSELALRAAAKGYHILVDLGAVVRVDESAPPRNRSLFARNSPMYWRPLLALHLRYCPWRRLLFSLTRQLMRGLYDALAPRKSLGVRTFLRRMRGGDAAPTRRAG